jgi:hypothetical protein
MADKGIVKVTINTRNFLKSVDKAPGKMKRVSAMALNNTAWSIKKKSGPAGMEKHLDRPTPFTKRGWRVLKAKAKQEPQTAWSYMAPIQDEYLKNLVTGGEETNMLPIPGRESTRNKYGNLPRRATKAKKAFWIKGKGGIKGYTVKQVGSKGDKENKVIAMWPWRRRYVKHTFPMVKVVRKGASRVFNREYRVAFRKVFK